MIKSGSILFGESSYRTSSSSQYRCRNLFAGTENLLAGQSVLLGMEP